MLNLRHMEHINAVVRAGSLTSASEELGISPPALSKSIRNLENQLGTKLFDRKGRVLTLTRFGREFTAEARRMLSQADYLESRAYAVASGEAGDVRLGTGALARQAILPKALANLVKNQPGLRIDVSDGTFPELVDSLIEYDLDLIVADTDIIDQHSEAEQLNSQKLAYFDMPILCRSNHPLLDKDDLSLHDIVNNRWVSPRIPNHYLHKFAQMARATDTYTTGLHKRLQKLPDIRMEDMHACLLIACETDCFTASTPTIAEPLLASGRLVRVPSPFLMKTEIAVITYTGRTLSAAATQLIDHLVAVSGKL